MRIRRRGAGASARIAGSVRRVEPRAGQSGAAVRLCVRSQPTAMSSASRSSRTCRAWHLGRRRRLLQSMLLPPWGQKGCGIDGARTAHTAQHSASGYVPGVQESSRFIHSSACLQRGAGQLLHEAGARELPRGTPKRDMSISSSTIFVTEQANSSPACSSADSGSASIALARRWSSAATWSMTCCWESRHVAPNKAVGSRPLSGSSQVDV